MGGLVRPVPLWLRLLVCAGIVALLVAGAWQARPPDRLTIETGPEGGSYYQAALSYQAILAQQGITLDVKAKANSLELIGDVANPASGIDVGFVAQDVSANKDGPVLAIGQIQVQPLFIFANAELGRRSTIDDLRGRKIVLPPQSSATADAAIRMFKLYDISPDNTSFTFAKLVDALRDLHGGKYDAGAFMLAPENDVVRDLINDSGLHLLPVPEARAVVNHLPYLRTATLPRGIYNIADAIPPDDTPMVAATVGVVVRQGLHPFLVYALLDAMSKTHRDAGFLNSAGEFPTLVGSQLTVHPLAAEYYQKGVPWTYRELPPWLASALDRYLLVGAGVVGVLLVLVVSTWLAAIVAAVLRGLAFVLLACGEAGRTVSSLQRGCLALADGLFRLSLPRTPLDRAAVEARLYRRRAGAGPAPDARTAADVSDATG